MKTHGKNPTNAMIAKTMVVSFILCVLSANGMPPAISVTPVRFHITVKSDTHQALIKSYLSRELRQLGNVEVVYAHQQYNLAVIHTHAAQSQSNFYSVVVTYRVPESHLEDKAQDRLGVSWVSHHGLLCFSRDIKEGCAEIVAEIDVNILEPYRQFDQAFTDKSK